MRHFILAATLVSLAAIVVGIVYGVSLLAFGPATTPDRPGAAAVVTLASPPEVPTKEAIVMRHRAAQETRGSSRNATSDIQTEATGSFAGLEVIGGDSNGQSLLEDLSHYRMVSDAGDAPALYRLAMDLLYPGNAEDLDVGTGVTYLKVAAGMGEAPAARALVRCCCGSVCRSGGTLGG
jgi:hypothetical protein